MSLSAPVRLRVEKTKIRLRVLPKLIPLDGKSVEMQTTDTYIQWRLVGDAAWTNLIALADIAGPKGDDGNPGPANSLSIGTVESGTDASATITGDAPSQTLNLVLPKGDKGDTGSPGADADIAVDTHAATSKATPVDADELPLVDSAASNVLKKLTWANLKATLKSYTDTLYLSTTLARREVLTANRTYYVASTGSDSNDGLTVGTPFATIQKAIDTVAALDISIYNVTINVAGGTYTAGVSVSGAWVGSGIVSIVGDAGTPSNVVISVTAGNCVLCNSGTLTVSGFKLATTTSGYALYGTRGGTITFFNCDFGAVGNEHIFAENGGTVLGGSNYTISGGAVRHMRASGGWVQIQNRTVTLSGTPAFSSAFAVAQNTGVLLVNGNTYSGAATGKRYSVSLNGVIQTAGGGASYFPGDTAGDTPSTGGQYA